MVFEVTLGNVIAILVSFAAALWALFKRAEMQRDGRVVERLTQVEGSLEAMEARLKHMEVAMRGALTQDDLGEVYTRLNALAEGVNKLAGEFGGAQRTLQLLHEYLLNGGRK